MKIIHNNFGVREQIGKDINGREAYIAFSQISRAEKKLKAYPGWLEFEGNNGFIIASTLPGSDTLIFVITFLLKNKYSPSYQEISEGVGVGLGAIFAQITYLIKLELLKNADTKFRRLRATSKTVKLWKTWFNVDLEKEIPEWIEP